jgi:hypothetical protein
MNYSKVLNLNVYMPLKITSWWETINNVFVNNTVTVLTLEGNDIQSRGINYGFNSSSTFKLPKDLSWN